MAAPRPPAPPPVEPQEGARPEAPASGPALPTPQIRLEARDLGSGEADFAKSEPEVLWDPADASKSQSRSVARTGPVLDVGSTPSALTTTSEVVSVPVVRAKGLGKDASLEIFLQEVGRHPVLTPDEERKLALDFYERKDPKAARKLVVHNLRLVVKMAYKYRRAWASVLDLIQEGNVGLVEAVERFDPFKGAKFSTYATFWIRAYMLRYLLEHSRTVRISRTRVGRKLFFQLARERSRLQAQGIEAGPKLLAERLGVDQADLEEVVRHMDQAEVRLDAPAHADDLSGATILDGMSSGSPTPESAAFRAEFETNVGAALEAFAATLKDPREKAAWEHHLMADEPASLSDLGAQFGVTKQRMGQIVQAMRKRLKAHLTETLGPDVELDYNFTED